MWWKALCSSFRMTPTLMWFLCLGGVKTTLTYHDSQNSDCDSPRILATTSQKLVWVYSSPAFKMPTFCGVFSLWFCYRFSIFIWSLNLLQKILNQIQLLRHETRGRVFLISIIPHDGLHHHELFCQELAWGSLLSWNRLVLMSADSSEFTTDWMKCLNAWWLVADVEYDSIIIINNQYQKQVKRSYTSPGWNLQHD